MYFFLRHLSITDLGYSTVIGPKMLVNFTVHKNSISYIGCATQLAIFEIFIITELFILSAMAYDPCVAICKPLLYVVIMKEKVRWGLVLTPYLYSTFVSLLLMVKLFTLSFCGSNVIRHLSITDLSYSTVIGPKMLVNFTVHKNSISYIGCATQLAIFEIFIITELFILSAMAYDRCVAICKPLLYVVIMKEKVCWGLVLTPYLYSTFVSLLLMVKLFTLSFCGSNVIRHISNSYMDPENITQVIEFVLIGVSEVAELQIPLFLVFLVIYGLTVLENLGIITLTTVDSQLQTPMYFFLRHLAVINLGNSTVIAPKMLVNFLVSKKTTSYYECATQLGAFLVFIVAEIFMLAVMAYDRYVAICNPLLYMAVVSQRISLLLVSLTYLYGFCTAIMVSSCVFSVSYCSSNVIIFTVTMSLC
ncbi:Hypothetical predicted protein [Marmota monax]|uniref:G-protein coupled receptors family 1 profile domain-containing protein n=1 Tax=Marmota monax TaxID=9995 RepID=A0A5E4D711_MARMO|nr:Hypothetical predicted protein [Marmota monax]